MKKKKIILSTVLAVSAMIFLTNPTHGYSINTYNTITKTDESGTQKLISGVTIGTTVDELKEKVIGASNVEVKNGDNEVTTGKIGTGMTLKVESDEYTIAVKGDIDGNSENDMTDIAMVKQNIVDLIKFFEAQKDAASINGPYEENQIGNFEVIVAMKMKLYEYKLHENNDNTLASQITPTDYGKSINYSVTIPTVTVEGNDTPTVTVEGNDTPSVTVEGNDTPSVSSARLGTGTVTLDDWKVLYNDGTNVYIILSGYLPANCAPKSIFDRAEYSSVNLDTTNPLLWYPEYPTHGDFAYVSTELRNKDNWEYLANGRGAISAMGGPTYEMLKNSWNTNPQCTTKLSETLEEQANLVDETTTKLYLPETGTDFSAHYYLAEPLGEHGLTWAIYQGWTGSDDRITDLSANGEFIRPVVCLDGSILGNIGDTITLE